MTKDAQFIEGGREGMFPGWSDKNIINGALGVKYLILDKIRNRELSCSLLCFTY